MNEKDWGVRNVSWIAESCKGCVQRREDGGIYKDAARVTLGSLSDHRLA